MSISNIRSIVEKPSCSIVISVVLVAVMVASMFYSCGGSNQQTQGAEVPSEPIAIVGDVTVTERQVKSFFEQIGQQQGMHDTSLPGKTYENVAALSQALKQGYQMVLAEKNGLKVSDEELTSYFNQMIEGEIMNARFQLMSAGRIKPDASEKDIADAFKAAYGKDPSQAKADALKELPNILKDPVKRKSLEADVMSGSLLKSYGDKADVTDKTLRESFQNYQVKSIYVVGSDAEKKASEALQAVKGGLAFEKAAEKYSTDERYKGKQTDQPISFLQVKYFPELKPLASLKAGQVSEIMKVGAAHIIYKLISVKSSLPADFDKNKQAAIQSYRGQVGQIQLQAALDDVRKTTTIDWKDSGYKVLWEMTQDGVEKTYTAEDYRRLAEEAEKAADDAPVGKEVAVLAWNYFLKRAIELEPSLKTQLADKLAMSSEAALVLAPDIDVYMSLTDLYIDQKKGDEAGQTLLKAASFNPDLGALGQSNYQAINGKVAKLEKLGLLKAELKTQIEAAQADWRENRLAKEKADAEEKAEREKAEAEQKRLEKEEAAKKAEVKDAPVPKPNTPK